MADTGDIPAHRLLAFLQETHTVCSEEIYRSSGASIFMLNFYNSASDLNMISEWYCSEWQEQCKTANNTGMTKDFILLETVHTLWPLLNLPTQVYIS